MTYNGKALRDETRKYNGKTLRYETRKTYNDIFGRTYTVDMQDWELEAEEYGATPTNHDHDLRMPNGDIISNEEIEWIEYKRNNYTKFPYKASDGTLCYTWEEYECWERGYYGS